MKQSLAPSKNDASTTLVLDRLHIDKARYEAVDKVRKEESDKRIKKTERHRRDYDGYFIGIHPAAEKTTLPPQLCTWT